MIALDESERQKFAAYLEQEASAKWDVLAQLSPKYADQVTRDAVRDEVMGVLEEATAFNLVAIKLRKHER